MTERPDTLQMSEVMWKAMRDEALPKPYGLKVSEIEAAALRGVMSAAAKQLKGRP